MTNNQIRRNTEIRMTKPSIALLSALRHSIIGSLLAFVICHSSSITCANHVHRPQCMRKNGTSVPLRLVGFVLRRPARPPPRMSGLSSRTRTRTSSESEHSINRPTPDPSQEGNERLCALPCEFIRSERHKNKCPRRTFQSGGDQMGGGSPPRSLSRAGIRRAHWLPASRRYSPRQAESSAS